MLTCHGCMRHCLQALIGDSVFISSTPRTTIRTFRSSPAYRRAYISLSHRPQDRELQVRLDQVSQEQQGKYQVQLGGRSQERQKWLDSRGTRPADKTSKPTKLPSASAHAVRFLKKDPLKLAEFVRDTLRGDEFDTAMEVVRDASKSMQCVVSWNHMIDWQLSKGRMNAAIKIYNEVLAARATCLDII